MEAAQITHIISKSYAVPKPINLVMQDSDW